MRRSIIKWRNRYAATPRAADMGIQVFSRLLSFGMEEGRLLNNLCFKLGRIYVADRSNLIWTEADLERLAKHASAEVMQAARLAALTGLRQTDLLRLCWTHIDANSIQVRTGKSRGRKTADVPIYADLRAYLDGLPRRAITVLVNTDGHPWKTGFGSSWGEAKRAAGLDLLHFHDLRGTAATRFYMGGQSIREIANTMAWSEDQVEALINRYVKRDELMLDRIRRLDENARGTPPVKPGVKPPP
jgi:integrase